MAKRIVSTILIILLLGSVFNTGYSIHSRGNLNTDNILASDEEYGLIMPEKNSVTVEENVLISGRAKMGSIIDISVYPLEDPFINKNIIAYSNKNLSDNNPIITKREEVGKLERFNVELELPLGKNEILIEINNEEDNYIIPRQISVTNEVIAKKYLSSTDTLGSRKIINSLIKNNKIN